MRRAALLIVLPFLAAPVSSQERQGSFTVVASGQSFPRLDAALASLQGGDGTIRIAPGTYRDCAVQQGGHVSFVAEKAGTVIFDRAICEGKAALVLRGAGSRVEGIVFTHMSVGDGNGAGIRMEKGDLQVVNDMFVDSQCGILSADDAGSMITIDSSTFSGLGKDPTGNGAHAVYVGGYSSLKITRSRFERGTGGHYVKTRAPRVEILDSSFDDSSGHTTNYMIDLSNGASGRIADNEFVDGKDKENHSTMITVAPEGAKNSSDALIVENNRATLAPGVDYTTALVGNWTRENVTVRNNKLGAGISDKARHWL